MLSSTRLLVQTNLPTRLQPSCPPPPTPELRHRAPFSALRVWVRELLLRRVVERKRERERESERERSTARASASELRHRLTRGMMARGVVCSLVAGRRAHVEPRAPHEPAQQQRRAGRGAHGCFRAAGPRVQPLHTRAGAVAPFHLAGRRPLVAAVVGRGDGDGVRALSMQRLRRLPSPHTARCKSCESQRFGFGAHEHEGQIPDFPVVRVHVNTGYNRVEGDRRASRNGPRARSPTRNR
jgi:hypothetical protein